MSAVVEYIFRYQGKEKEVLLYFHEFLSSHFLLEPKIRYNIPFYYGKTWICSLHVNKKGKVEFTFIRGNELNNESGLYDAKGRKLLISKTFENVEDIPEDTIYASIQEAIFLDKTVPFTLKPKN